MTARARTLFFVSTLAAAAAFAPACASRSLPPTGQVILFVDTDTVVPLDPTEAPDETIPGPLFDRLRIELYAPGDSTPCQDCTREFSVDRKMFLDRKVSTGLVPKPGVSGYRARVLLYRGFGEQSTGPRPTSTLESVVSLPVIQAEGLVNANVFLATDNLTKPQGTLDAPVAAVTGDPPLSKVDSWQRDRRKTCAGAPASDHEVCIPGGAYWIGDLTASIPAEQIVAISPFFLDTTEVTVAAARTSPLLQAALGAGDIKYVTADPNCTFSTQPSTRETTPLTCVRRVFADKYCAAQSSGGRLMSEAEFAYVASGRVGTSFVWGNDTPNCPDAVFGRGLPSQPSGDRVCVSAGSGPGEVAKGQRDILTVRTGRVFDLAGNVAEWMRDDYEPLTGPCWTSPVLVDPVCSDPGKHQAVRGGSWNAAGAYLFADERANLDAVGTDTGFRCARDGL
jgi:formylglycine-generating enzyme required for sulfatase activity